MLSRLSDLLLIRQGERQQVIYFFALYAIIGVGMAFGRNSADVLFFKRYGIEFLPVMYMVLSIFLALVSTVYAAFADRISPERLSIILYATLICILLANWAWMSFSDVGVAYPAYFLLYEIASELLIVHSIHYVSQNFDSLQAKRLFPMIMAGTQIGIITGSLALAAIAQYINIQDIILAWCALLFVPMYMIYSWHKQRGSSSHFRPMRKSTDQFKQAVSQISYGFTLIKTSRLLKAASLALFFMVIAFYILSYSINRIYTDTFESEAALTSFFGILSATTNSFALLLQIFISNRVIHRFGVKKVNLFFPITSLFSYLALLSSFTLIPALIGSINKDAIMPAFRNPIRTIFFNTLPENVRGRARAISVVIVLPLALFACGALLIAMQKMGEPVYFLAFGLIATVLYLLFNLKMNRAYVSEMLSTLRKKVLIADDMDTATSFNRNLAVTADTIKEETFKSDAIIKLFNMLMVSFPDKANELLLLNSDQHESRFVDQIARILAPVNPPGFSDILNDIFNETSDIHLQSSVLVTLFKLRDRRVISLIPSLLDDKNPLLQSTAIIGVLHQDGHQNDAVLKEKAIKLWARLASSSDITKQLVALNLTEYLPLVPESNQALLPIYKSMIDSVLRSNNQTEVTAALNALLSWPEPEFPEIADLLSEVYDRSNTSTRLLCVKCCRLFYHAEQSLLKKAIEDSSRQIRQEAARIHYEVAGEDAKDIFVLWLSSEANGSPRAQRAFLGLLHDVSTDVQNFQKIARNKAESAQNFFLGHQILNRFKDVQSAPFQLVKHILQERTKQYIDLSVYAMKGFEKPEDTYVVWAGLNSRDPRHIANACEVLRNSRNKELGEMLSDLVAQQPIKFGKQASTRFTDNIESVLSWCAKLPDPWLSLCAKQALESLG